MLLVAVDIYHRIRLVGSLKNRLYICRKRTCSTFYDAVASVDRDGLSKNLCQLTIESILPKLLKKTGPAASDSLLKAVLLGEESPSEMLRGDKAQSSFPGTPAPYEDDGSVHMKDSVVWLC